MPLRCSLGEFGSAPAFAAAEEAIGLAEALAFGYEFVGRSGVEFEHLVVAGDDNFGADLFPECGGFFAVKVAGNAALGKIAVDRQECDVYLPALDHGHDVGVPFGVAGMVNAPWAGLDDVTEELVTAPGISLKVVVCSGHGVKAKAFGGEGIANVHCPRCFSH